MVLVFTRKKSLFLFNFIGILNFDEVKALVHLIQCNMKIFLNGTNANLSPLFLVVSGTDSFTKTSDYCWEPTKHSILSFWCFNWIIKTIFLPLIAFHSWPNINSTVNDTNHPLLSTKWIPSSHYGNLIKLPLMQPHVPKTTSFHWHYFWSTNKWC